MDGTNFATTHPGRDDLPCGTRQACHSSGFITCGPWILSIISIVILGTSLRGIAASSGQQLLLSSLIHIHAVMLVLTGAPALVMARFAADAFSEEHPEKILPSFLATLTATCVLAALGSGAFFLLVVSASPFFQLAATALSVLVAACFVTAGYLGALRCRGSILISFLCGYALSCGLASLLLHHNPGEPAFALSGFALGHLVLFLMLFAALHRELPPALISIDYSSFRHFLRFPDLAFCGICCSAGIWIDKLMLWWFPGASYQVNAAIFASPQGHVAAYGAILSIIPGLLVFHIKLEANLAGQIFRYFRSLHSTGTLSALRSRKDEIKNTLREGLILLVRIQGTTTAVLLLFTEEITDFFSLETVQIGSVRIILLGAFFLVLFLVLLTFLFSIDDRRGSLAASGIFLATNAGASLVSLLAGTAYPGIGFAFASCCACAFAAARTHHLLAGLEFRNLDASDAGPASPDSTALPAD